MPLMEMGMAAKPRVHYASFDCGFRFGTKRTSDDPLAVTCAMCQRWLHSHGKLPR